MRLAGSSAGTRGKFWAGLGSDRPTRWRQLLKFVRLAWKKRRMRLPTGKLWQELSAAVPGGSRIPRLLPGAAPTQGVRAAENSS